MKNIITFYFFLLPVLLMAQDEFHKFSISGQVFQCYRTTDIGLVLTKDLNVSSDIQSLAYNVPNIPGTNTPFNPRSYFSLDKTQILGSLNFGYNFDLNNSLHLYSEFFFNYHYLIIDVNTTGNGGGRTDFGDLMLNLVYFRRIKLTNFIKLKLGAGIGLLYAPKDDFNSIFNLPEKISFGGTQSYNNERAFYLEDGIHVFTTKENYRHVFNLNLAPKVEIEFTKKNKSYFSIVFGMNIIPYKNIGIQGSLYDGFNNKLLKTERFSFNNANFYIGLGYTLAWD
jgi:hypothetical protein